MRVTVTRLAGLMQLVFRTLPAKLAAEHEWAQRSRKLDPAGFVRTLVMGWIDDPHAPLETLAGRLGVSPQAVRGRMGPPCQKLFAALITEALGFVAAARPSRLKLLRRFDSVVVQDCTSVRLPDELADDFPATGGRGRLNRAGLKISLTWDVTTGRILGLSWHAGKTSDRAVVTGPKDLPDGSLFLADLGFFDASRLALFGDRKHYISRLPAATHVRHGGDWEPLAALLGRVEGDLFDEAVEVVRGKPLGCRLVARRCPPEVAGRRRQALKKQCKRRDGSVPSRRRLALCDWVVLITDLAREEYDPVEVWVLYRARWQVELLFKKAKQRGGLGFTHGTNGDRVMAEWLGKLLGLIVSNHALLLSGPPLAAASFARRQRVVRDFACRLRDALAGAEPVEVVLRGMRKRLHRVPKVSRRTGKPGTRQLLSNPALAA